MHSHPLVPTLLLEVRVTSISKEAPHQGGGGGGGGEETGGDGKEGAGTVGREVIEVQFTMEDEALLNQSTIDQRAGTLSIVHCVGFSSCSCLSC